MSDGVSNLEMRISQFETLLDEMKAETREAHSALKFLQRERKEIERLLGSKEIKKLVDARVSEVVGGHLEKIGPEIREQTNLIYARVGEQIDKLIDLSLGREFARQKGREDIRPALAEKLREWIREITGLEEASKP